MAMNSAFLKKRICLLKSMATTAFNKWSRTILFIIFLDKSQTNVSFSSRSSRAFISWASDEKLMSNFWAGLHVHEGPCNLLLGTVPRSKWKPGQTGYFWMPKLRAMLFPLSNYVAIGKGLTAITGRCGPRVHRAWKFCSWVFISRLTFLCVKGSQIRHHFENVT